MSVINKILIIVGPVKPIIIIPTVISMGVGNKQNSQNNGSRKNNNNDNDW